MSKKNASAVSEEVVMSRIHTIRGHKVMLDSDLAELYEVATKALKQAVRRNLDSFPEDFMFELTPEEWENLRSQNVTSSHGGARYPPMAFSPALARVPARRRHGPTARTRSDFCRARVPDRTSGPSLNHGYK